MIKFERMSSLFCVIHATEDGNLIPTSTAIAILKDILDDDNQEVMQQKLNAYIEVLE